MRTRSAFTFPSEQQDLLARVRRLEWMTIAVMTGVVIMIYFVQGSSQAMKTAWVEDLLSLLPPMVYLVSIKVAGKSPDVRFPYGYRRILSIAFLCTSLAFAAFGGPLLYESASTLIRQERPTIGAVEVFGNLVWLGWLMIGALALSTIGPIWLGRIKVKMARELHLKALYAEAEMNRADWQTALFGIVGVLGIGFGYWWADSAAAILIAQDVVREGVAATKNALADLVDRRPSKVESSDHDPVIDSIRGSLERLPWVRSAEVRLREEGDALAGEAYLVPHDWVDLPERLKEANEVAAQAHWRLYDLPIVLEDARHQSRD